MPLHSMTGYASVQQAAPSADSEAPRPARRLGLEIRSVNSRFLDLAFRLPDELRATEPALRTLLTAQLKRGKVEVRAVLEQDSTSALPQPSPLLLQRLNTVQDQVRAWLPEARPLSVADALRWCTSSATSDEDWNTVVPALAAQAITALQEARAREGARLGEMLQDRVQQLRALAAQAEPLVPQVVAQQRQRFVERWKEALALADSNIPAEAAQERALTEATALAIRLDIAEEITRLRSHLDEIERLLKKGGEAGKRLEFLIQELHREANTLGSKSAALELTRVSVDMKVLIEQMREQIQNIE